MENFQAGFEERLFAALGRYPGFAETETRRPPVFLAALSGGADSTALTAALGELRDSAAAAGGSGSGKPRPSFIVRCLHVNHNIRGREECFGDERHVIALCKSLSIPLRIHRIRPGAVRACARIRGTGIEAAARRFRYGALRREALRVGAGAILVAHTRDDLLETVLMAVLRGSGPAGLGAMAAESGGVPASGVPIVRPLLGITRAEVEGYLAERGLSYTTDSSNSDTRFLRNRIRRLLVPLLDREFPHWQAPLLSLNKTQAGIAGFLASEASRRLPWKQEGESLFLGEKDFFAQSFAIREEALFQALDTLSRGPLSPTAVSVAASGFAAPGDFRPRRAALKPFIAGKKAACDLGPFRLEKKGGRITAGPGTVFHRAFSVLIKNPGLYKLETLTLRSLPDTMTERPVSSCGFFASFPLIVRSLERKERVEVRDRDGRAVIVSLQGEIIWVRKRGSRNGSCIVVETAAQKPAGE